MSERVLPRYPVYVPSKGRYDNCQTAKFLARDRVPFTVVVEPKEAYHYAAVFGKERVLVLPEDDVRLVGSRNFIKEHATAAGYERHWQLDDNIKQMRRLYHGKRIPCESGPALAAIEDYSDRYENLGVSGPAYTSFVRYANQRKTQPVLVNVRVYSASLVNNAMPYRWRIYNDDTDFCLQALAGGWCTALVFVFLVDKAGTMTTKGGNTEQHFMDGRLEMARGLERMWPHVTTTERRFHRPQHAVRDGWRKFDTKLRLKPGISLDDLPERDYGLTLKAVKEVQNPTLRGLLLDAEGRNASEVKQDAEAD